MKKYYHFTEIPDLDLEVLKEKTLHFFNTTKERLDAEFLIFNWHNFNRAVPELGEALGKWGYTIVQYGAFVMRTKNHAPPHRDDTIIPIRLNIPICNTEHTWTSFFENNDASRRNDKPENIPSLHKINNGLRSIPYKNQDIHMVDRMQLTSPAWIRPMEIHSVICEEGFRMPRIALTLALDPLPYELFPNIPSDDRPKWQDLCNLNGWHEPIFHGTVHSEYTKYIPNYNHG